MGASASKSSRAAGSAARQYPTRAPPTSSSSQTTAQATTTQAPTGHAARYPPPPPEQHPSPQKATASRNAAINLDASDPDFAASLRSLGPVQPNPTLSPSSAFGNRNLNTTHPSRSGPNPRENPALTTMAARARLQEAADMEFQEAGKKGHAGRQFLDVYMLRQVLVLRDEKGMSAEAIERKMGLRRGVVARLGGQGVIKLAMEQGRASEGVEMV